MLSRIGIFLACLFAGVWSSTLLLVGRLGVSEGAFKIGDYRFFAPWLWIEWFIRYGKHFQPVFLETSWPLYLSVFLGVGLAWISRLLFHSEKQSTAHGSARWALEEEVKKAGLMDNSGVILGQSIQSNKLLSHKGPEHVLAIAPTRGGKGVGLVIPTLLTWKESVIVFDPKGENWQITSGHRAQLGPCYCFNPTKLQTTRFNPLMEIRKGDLEVKDAQNIADIIVDPDGRLETRNHWQNAAHALLVGSILYVYHFYPRKSLSGVVQFLTRPGQDFEATLKEMSESGHAVVNGVAQEMLNKHVEERSGVLSTAVSLLSIFRDPLVAQATDGHDFAISDLKSQVSSLYLVLPPSDISRLRVLLRLLLNQMGRVLTEDPIDTAPSGKKILFLLDEFPSLGRLEFFETALAYMAGYGLKAFLICQSLNQLQKAYGERNSILDNCHVRVAFANNDDQTARRLSDLLGEQTLSKVQTSLSGSRFAVVKQSASLAHIEFGRPLLLPSEINRLPYNQEIIFINGLFPILAHKIRYFEDPRFLTQVLPPFALPERREFIEKPGTEIPINKALSNVVTPKVIGSAL